MASVERFGGLSFHPTVDVENCEKRKHVSDKGLQSFYGELLWVHSFGSLEALQTIEFENDVVIERHCSSCHANPHWLYGRQAQFWQLNLEFWALEPMSHFAEHSLASWSIELA